MLIKIKVGTVTGRQEIIIEDTLTPMDAIEQADVALDGATITLDGIQLTYQELNTPFDELGVEEVASLTVSIKTANA